MPYKFQPGKMYMMPIHFGPSMGPRQGPEGRTFECKDNPKTTSISVSFLTNREQLEELLPERFEVGAGAGRHRLGILYDGDRMVGRSWIQYPLVSAFPPSLMGNETVRKGGS